MAEANEQREPSRFLDYPELRQSLQYFLEQMPGLFQKHIESGAKTRRSGSIGVAVFIVLLIIAVVVLAFWNKISSDAIAFLFGTIVGASFTYLRDLLPR